jgi:hypothetical protein
VLRHDTIERLRMSATPPDAKEKTKYFGEYLQWHLDQYPPLDWQTWQAFLAVSPQIAPKPAPKTKKRLSPAERAALIELKDAMLAEEIAQEQHRRKFVRPFEARKK